MKIITFLGLLLALFAVASTRAHSDKGGKGKAHKKHGKAKKGGKKL